MIQFRPLMILNQENIVSQQINSERDKLIIPLIQWKLRSHHVTLVRSEELTEKYF